MTIYDSWRPLSLRLGACPTSKGVAGRRQDGAATAPLSLKVSYFTSLAIPANAPTSAGAPGLMVWLDGPPERVPAGDTVLESTGTSTVTELALRQLRELFTMQSRVLWYFFPSLAGEYLLQSSQLEL